MTSFSVRNLNNSAGSATISDYGAHVLRWAPAGQPDVVWGPSSLTFTPGGTLGGGVPVVFPWFGPGFTDGHQTAKSPIHGFARRRFWRLETATFTHEHARYTLDADQLDDGDLPWLDAEPSPRFTADYDVTAGSELTMALTVTNEGDSPMSFEAALHTYLHVGEVSGARLAGLQGATYLDATQPGFPACTQSNPEVTFGDGAVDRVYTSDAPLDLRDDVLGRTIRITKAGSPQTVVWNPGQPYGGPVNEAVADEWRTFVCVEAAVCRDQAVTLAPGASHTLSQTLTVQ